jgi:hypothetical protein
VIRGAFGLLFALSASEPARGESERCRDYADGKRLGTLDDKDLDELSGLAASVRFPGVLWAHNDSGGDPELFAISEDGEHLATFELENAEMVDWEDLALSRCSPSGSRRCLYIADTGNNDFDRDDQVIYRLDEPEPDGTSSPVRAEWMAVYFESPADVEAMFLDAQAQIWLVGKSDTEATLFRVGRFEAETSVIAEPVAERDDIDFITAADASEDGTRIILRSSRHAWEIFRPAGRSMGSAFLGEALEVRLDKEAQGEAIAFAPDGDGFFSTSEGRHSPLRWYRCKSMGPTLAGKEDGAIVEDPIEPLAGCGAGATSLGGLALIIIYGRRRRS